MTYCRITILINEFEKDFNLDIFIVEWLCKFYVV